MQKTRKVVLGALTAAIIALLPSFDARANPSDPYSLYGEEIFFDVYRDGDKVGFHRVRFSGSGDDLTVRSDFELEIDFLFLTAFRYLYNSEGQWRQGRLESLTATVDDDGEDFAFGVFRDGPQLRIEKASGNITADAPLFPTTHWNVRVLDQSQVLNTLTGLVNQVRIESRARETVATERGEIPATRYAYTGELETEVWYDDAGRWVKLRFDGRDGSNIEYLCRRCQGARVDKAQR